MGKKVSAILFRVLKFNNYKNFWVFNFRDIVNIKFIEQYYRIKNSCLKNVEDFQLNFFNKIYQFYGKIPQYLFNYKLLNKFIFSNIFFINIFGIIYKISLSFYSIHFIKYFIIQNILKYNSIQMLYKHLYSNFIITFIDSFTCLPRVKIIISGRLNNTRLASSEMFQFGIISFNKIKNFIKYENFSIQTKYGLLGVKLWVENITN